MAASAKVPAPATMGAAPLFWLLEVLLLPLGVLVLPLEEEEPVIVAALTGCPIVLHPSVNSSTREKCENQDAGELDLATYDQGQTVQLRDPGRLWPHS
jgi:hypothetical protein